MNNSKINNCFYPLDKLYPFPNILLFGRPGSGKKNTVISLRSRLSHTITYVFSKNFTRDTLERVAGGKLLDNKEANQIALRSLPEKFLAEEIIIAEGYPRTLEQLDFFINLSAKYQHKWFGIWLDVSVEECQRRLILGSRDRAHCLDYNQLSLDKKLKDFETYTLPMLEILFQAGCLARIDVTSPLKRVGLNQFDSNQDFTYFRDENHPVNSYQVKTVRKITEEILTFLVKSGIDKRIIK